ncbi:MAG: hypothetical protein QM831_12690 [Kofleriaceae bacterium]
MWLFDESEAYVRTWRLHEGSYESGADRLVLTSAKTWRLWDGEDESEPDNTVFEIALVDGAPATIRLPEKTLPLHVVKT